MFIETLLVLAISLLIRFVQSIIKTAAKKCERFIQLHSKLILYGLTISCLDWIQVPLLQGNRILNMGYLFVSILQPMISIYQNILSLCKAYGGICESTTLHLLKVFIATPRT